jgi:hypothetical protein
MYIQKGQNIKSPMACNTVLIKKGFGEENGGIKENSSTAELIRADGIESPARRKSINAETAKYFPVKRSNASVGIIFLSIFFAILIKNGIKQISRKQTARAALFA